MTFTVQVHIQYPDTNVEDVRFTDAYRGALPGALKVCNRYRNTAKQYGAVATCVCTALPKGLNG